MKKVVLFISAVMMTVNVFSQSASENMVPFDKGNVSGVSITTDYNVKMTAEALQKRLETEAGLKGHSLKKFRYYQSQQFPEFGPLNFDIYTQVATTGKKKDQKTTIYLLVSQGNNNFISSTSNPEVIENVKNFLNQFVSTYLPQYDLEQKVEDQEKLIAKLEKENKSLMSDKDKLNKQLESKEKEITAKREELAKAKDLLNSLKSK